VANLVAYFPIVFGIEGSLRGLWQTGLPYTAYYSTSLNGDNQVDDIAAGHTRNDMRQPTFAQFDIRLSRTFAIYRSMKVEGIVDIFNLFNKADFTVPTGNYAYASGPGVPVNASFGQLAAVDKNRTREMQVGIKVMW